jgi:hypothetical protein
MLNAQPKTRNARYLAIGVPSLALQKCTDRADRGVTAVTKHRFYLALPKRIAMRQLMVPKRRCGSKANE